MQENKPERAPNSPLSRVLDMVLKSGSNPLRAYYKLHSGAAGYWEDFRNRTRRANPGLGFGSVPEAAVLAQPGITVVTLSYKRLVALAALLDSILEQDLGDIKLELIVCNNSKDVYLRESRFSRVGRRLSKFKHKRIINSSYNWRCRVRYALATLASYDTIMFVDDDITLIDRNFIRYMFDTFRALRPIDIVSCWNSLWVDWTEDHFRSVSLTFETPQITELTPTDTVGPGISMFSKRILLNPKVLEMSRDFPRADDMAFPLIAAMEWGSRSYYLPSYSMLKMHDQGIVRSLNTATSHYEELYSQYKMLLKGGYQPVLLRNDDRSREEISSARRAASTLPIVTFPWK